MNNVILNECRKILSNFPKDLNYIHPEELYSQLKINPEKFFLVDNRDQNSYNNGHIENSVNIYLKDLLLEENLERLPQNKIIVIICWVGHTASQLITMLQLLGYNAIGLKYGMGKSAIDGESQSGWEQLGFPVNKII